MEEGTHCQVALPRPLHQTFAYELPPELRGAARPGMRVLVPFRRRRVVGVIDALTGRPDLPRIRRVVDLLDDEPLLEEREMELCRWVARYYVSPVGLVLRAALPPGLFAESTYRVYLAADGAPGDGGADGEAATETSDAERRVLRRLGRAHDGLQVTTLRDELGRRSAWPVIRGLGRRGLVRVEEEPPDARPPERTRQVVRVVRDLPTLRERDEIFGRAYRQREAYEVLESLDGEAPVQHLADQLGFSRSVLHGLVDRGLAEIQEEAVVRDPARAAVVEAEAGEEVPRLRPTADQATVIQGLLQQLDEEEPGVALLRGVTGSGKTLVYLEVLEEVVDERGQGAIVLVPEISLTPQTVRRFRARFGDRVAVLHSGLSAGERFDEWRALRRGEKKVAVGPRSAVFAPVRDLGAVVVDEEHEGSYKQSETPRYHARALAAVRCRQATALCILGSATPALESWSLARRGRYRLYELLERATPHPLPDVELVDLRGATGDGETGDGEAGDGGTQNGGARDGASRRRPIFSPRLRGALADCLERGDQAILLLNRRGYSTFVQCTECGKVWECRRCSVSLTYHRGRNRMTCHHCGYEARVPERCDACGGPRPLYAGVGTEQVERRLGEVFPGVQVARMDVDTTGTKWAHEKILRRMRRREVDVLLGTQMIAKGLDLPGVTLVGVVNADVGLNLPDFRATERTFQLLAQVAGRAGRGDRPGQVLVQTARADHFALRAAVRHDYEAFAARELTDREMPGYPPHRRLANLVVSGPEEDPVAAEARELAAWTRGLVESQELEGVEVVGPAPCPIHRLRSRWRWHFLLKSREARPLGAVLRYLADRRGQPSGDLRVEIDRDPEALL